MENLLKLIKAGDQDVILDDNEKVKQLEILVDTEMVSIKNGKFFLTKKAEYALYTGMDEYLMEYPLNKKVNSSTCKKMDTYMKSWDRKRNISILVWFLLLLIGITLRHYIIL